MNNESFLTRRIKNWKAFISEYKGEFTNPNNKPKEKAWLIVFSPLMFPLTLAGIAVGYDKTEASLGSMIISILIYMFMLIAAVIEYGPALIAQLNTMING